ncbi:MAG: GGDEF domain-containing protein, partial [Thermomicrobiaceae bacterium]|nr:GGDEF domain-containing protein [Thermomicrobiaceae bacterium]
VGVGSEDRLIVVAAAGPSSEEVEVAELPLDALPPAARDRLATGAAFDLVGEDLAALRSLLAVGPTAQALVVVPIVVREALRGAILVTSRAPLPPHARGGLRALAAQVALALESAALTDGLRRSEARFRSLVQNSSDVITVIETDTTIRYQSPSVARVLGYGPAELVGAKLIELIHPDDARRAYAFFVEAVDQPGVTPPAEWRLRCKDGSWLHAETVANSLLDDPTVGGLVLNTRDVSERKSLEAQIVHQAFHDPLTGLPNRALFLERLQQALDRPSRREGSVAILFLDLDRFKVVNDSLGHEAGDQLLTAVATRLQLCVRPSDIVARLGGDEFALLLENLPSAEVATGVAARIVEQLQVPISLDGREVVVGTSIGVAFGTPRQERPDE